MDFEDAVFSDAFPVNSLAALERMRELLEEGQTNSADILQSASERQRHLEQLGMGSGFMKDQLNLDDSHADRYRAYLTCLWFLNAQVYGEMGRIDMEQEWRKLYEARTGVVA